MLYINITIQNSKGKKFLDTRFLPMQFSVHVLDGFQIPQ